MKLHQSAKLLAFGIIVIAAVTGCKRRPYGPTPIPGTHGGATGTQGPGQGVPSGSGLRPDDEVGRAGGYKQGSGHPGWLENRETFQSDTVHFDFDSSVVKASEKSKVASVADYLKVNQTAAVKIEGHCDERGTEEYNRSLGERRALALREELIRSGTDPERVDTLSFGKDKPAANGHDDSSWSQNRRGEFILLTPPK